MFDFQETVCPVGFETETVCPVGFETETVCPVGFETYPCFSGM